MGIRVGSAAEAWAVGLVLFALLGPTIPFSAALNGPVSAGPQPLTPRPDAALVNDTPALAIRSPPAAPVGSTEIPVEATWGPAPTGCRLRSEWSEWYLPDPARAAGTFANPGGARTVFVPASPETTTSEVGVRSDAELVCSGSNRTIASLAYSNLTTFPRPTLGDVEVDPSATVVPGRVQLSGVIDQGRPPFFLGVDWRDGSYTNETLLAAGSFRIPHVYGLGSYFPRVGLFDGDRIEVRATVPEPVEVTNGTALAINASVPLAEVGVPVGFHGIAERPELHFGSAIACVADPFVRPTQYITNVTCTPTLAGTLEVTYKLGAPAPILVVRVSRYEPVAPPPMVEVAPIASNVEAGVPTYVRVTISGGVPPFVVACASTNGTLDHRSDVPGDGAFLVPWTPPSAGASALKGSVTDAFGVSESSPWWKLSVEPASTLTASVTTTIAPGATTVEVRGSILGSAGPWDWGLVASPWPLVSTVPVGVSGSGAITWSGNFTEEGNAMVVLQVVDSAGEVLTQVEAVALPLPPALQVVASLSVTTEPPELRLTLTTSGGVPPFSLWVNQTGETLWNGSESAPGPYAINVGLNGSGAVGFSVQLVDARGDRADQVFSENLSGNPPAVPVTPVPLSSVATSDLAPWFVAAGLALVAVVVGVAYGRRPERKEPPAVPDAEQVLEQLLRPADGADRLTIELMAEEEGVPLETARTSLDRLIEQGRVRSEHDPDGGEVLAWADA